MAKPIPEMPSSVFVALVGRPNVGKSSLSNKLLGQERTMVSDIPGTTRDAIDTLFTDTDGTRFNIIDTAGMRKKILSDLKFMSYAPVLFLSALTGQRVNTVLDAVKAAYAQ